MSVCLPCNVATELERFKTVKERAKKYSGDTIVSAEIFDCLVRACHNFCAIAHFLAEPLKDTPVGKTTMKLRSALLLSFLLLITHGCVAVPEKTPESRLEPGMELDFMFAEDEAFWGRSLEETSMSMTVPPSWCKEGCNLQVDIVCGIDGITYANECLAVCQVRLCESFRVSPIEM